MLKPTTAGPQQIKTSVLVLVPVVLVVFCLCTAIFIASKIQLIKGRLLKIIATIDNRPEKCNRASPISAKNSYELTEQPIPVDQEAALHV